MSLQVFIRAASKELQVCSNSKLIIPVQPSTSTTEQTIASLLQTHTSSLFLSQKVKVLLVRKKLKKIREKYRETNRLNKHRHKEKVQKVVHDQITNSGPSLPQNENDQQKSSETPSLPPTTTAGVVV